MTLSSYGDILEAATMANSSLTVDYLDIDENVTKVAVPLIKQPVHILVLYTIAYVLVFVVGLIGNGFVMTVIYKDPTMRNVTNYFILNLAVADLLVVFVCVPMTLLGSIFTGEFIRCLVFLICIF